jgi:hypothetical protein
VKPWLDFDGNPGRTGLVSVSQPRQVIEIGSISTRWRCLKHAWLYLHSLDSASAVERLVAFYVEQHSALLARHNPDWHVPDPVRNDRVVAALCVCARGLGRMAPGSEWPKRVKYLIDESPLVRPQTMGLPVNSVNGSA